MARLLPLVALLFAPSCMVAINDIDVKRADGGEDHYKIKRRGDTLSYVEASFGSGERIQSARLIVFADLDEDRRVDDGEVLHDLGGSDFDEPWQEVRWRNLRLDEGEHDGPFAVRLELVGTQRGEIVKTIRVLPESLIDDLEDIGN